MSDPAWRKLRFGPEPSVVVARPAGGNSRLSPPTIIHVALGAVTNICREYELCIILKIPCLRVGVKVQLKAFAHVDAMNTPHNGVRHPSTRSGKVGIGRIAIVVMAGLPGRDRRDVHTDTARKATA